MIGTPEFIILSLYFLNVGKFFIIKKLKNRKLEKLKSDNVVLQECSTLGR